ncbi:hypothetical protein P9268_12580 [Oceanobacillus caeni]|nr:hypothetical protein [Oceanobacillus caeni]
MKYLFEQLPNIDSTNEEAMDQLLPWSTTIPLTVKVQIKS